MMSPSAGFPKTFRTSLEKTQSCPCNIRARGLTTIPGIEGIQRPTLKVQRPTLNAEIHWPLGIRRWTFGVENANRHTILNRPSGNQEIAQWQGARSL